MMGKNIKDKNNGKSLMVNIGYNMISQIVALVVPLFTSPYIARVFNPELIGRYSYALANSSYFVLVECLGFSLYGQIKIAAKRDDKEETSRLFWEIIILKLLLMALSSIAYLAIIFIRSDAEQRGLSGIMLLNIIAAGIDVTWFLNGLEEFKTIAIRSIGVRLVNIISIFTLIKSDENFLLYAVIMQGANLIANLTVYPKVFKNVRWCGLKGISIFQHFRPAAIYFVPGVVNTIFSSSDKTMLGIWSGDFEVGIYEQANKISQICMNAVCAIGNVILPRASYLYHNDNAKEMADKLIYTSLGIVQLISVPAVLGIISISEEFVLIFFGTGYEKSAAVLVILSFNVMLIALSNLCGQQCLIARERQREYNIAIIISALVNVILNVFAIKAARSIGAAIASVLASVVCLYSIIYMSKGILSIKKIFLGSWKYYVSGLLMSVLIISVKKILYGSLGVMILHVAVGIIIYVLFLILFKEQIVQEVWQDILKKLRRNG